MTDGVSTREIILDILLAVTRDGEYSHLALSGTLNKYQYLEKQERAFITKVTEGTLEQMIKIDYIINSFSNIRVSKMKPVIRCILRSAVYQICFLDGVPDSAACNEAVNLAGKRGFRNLKGFVNGVLRNIARKKEQIVYPDERKQPQEAVSVQYSLPLWLVEQWETEYGMDKTKAMAKALLEEKPTAVRINLNQITKEELIKQLKSEGVDVTESKELPYALFLSGYDYLNKLSGFQEGCFYVQDISSMKVAETAEPKEGDVVLDVCGAPGGKSIHIAQMLQGTGQVITRDLTPSKVAKIEENIARCRVENMRAECADARVPDESLREKADIVIADLPCSGLGVIGRKKDIKYKMTPEKEQELVALQREILSVVPAYVKSGGTLVYSTCTIHKTENEENVQWLLENHRELHLESMQQIFPDETGNDGFFIAKLRKN
ncbi:MAG: 16S rRNA (cytosine(967)-C(5))-methyltransferase RsmB [Lachnospiraceae bacterium]|nr:16S rRNA (cytosine(967)-C(5))-methyltransferase RsmB [Lachnospiraceae bacterium]MDY4616464.1 16S rRNA (cytosine(967)-C(5))-methyltransferase RsmB [Lachnospiraceae bacterium]